MSLERARASSSCAEMTPIWVAQWKLEVLPLSQLTSEAVGVEAQINFLRTHLGPILTASTSRTSDLHRTTSYHFMRYRRPIDLESWSHRTGAVIVVRLFAPRRYLGRIITRFRGLVANWRARGELNDEQDDGISDWA